MVAFVGWDKLAIAQTMADHVVGGSAAIHVWWACTSLGPPYDWSTGVRDNPRDYCFASKKPHPPAA